MKRRDTFLLACLLVFFISLFAKRLVEAYTVMMVFVAIAAFIYNPFHQKIQLFKERSYIWFMLAFVGMIIFSFFLSSDKEYGTQALLRRLPLLIFPISVGLIKLSKELRNKLLLSFAVIVTIACFVCLGWGLYKYKANNSSAWIYNDALSYIVGQQSIYTSVLVNISIYIFTWHILYGNLTWSKRAWSGVAIVFLFIISYLLASRNMMLILYISVIAFAFYIVFKRKKYLEGIAILMGILLGGFFVLKFFPKTLNRFKELTYTKFSYEHEGAESHYNMEVTADQWNGANFRLAAWPCGWELFKQNPMSGVGIGDKKDDLFKVYEEKKFQFALSTRKNVHNNYLDILMSMGVIGLFLFLAGWIILPLVKVIRNRDGLGLLILLTFTIAMLTENYFDRTLGATLFGFIIPFLLSSYKKENLKDDPQ